MRGWEERKLTYSYAYDCLAEICEGVAHCKDHETCYCIGKSKDETKCLCRLLVR
jgi:hypothetical protein